MSILNTLYIGVNGMNAHGEAMSTVGDNIANTSTIGFKRARANFQDMLGGELGGQRLGGGVRLGANQTMWQQGAIQQTGNPLDVAINGGGTFVVKGNHQGVEGQYYTRDGRFSMDKSGYVVTQNGMRVQGYTLGSDGTRSANFGDLPLAARQSPPVPSTKASMTLNLNASDPVKPAVFDPADPITTSNFQTSMTVYDSLGKAHNVDVYFKNMGNGTWDFHALANGAEITGGTPGTPVEIGTGSLTFDTDGKLVSQNVTASANFAGATQNQAIAMSFGDDIASGGTGLKGTTQFAATQSVVTARDIDGHASGNLIDIAIAEDGTITGKFDNGDSIDLARLAIADFANQEGLERLGDNVYGMTRESGDALVDISGVGARGGMVSGALESSNVDLGQELVTLIAYQRAFQANAKTVTTADEMLLEVTNLKR
jgi:flagellar hook protein FlgE